MLLTLKPPIQNGVKGPHEYSIIRQSIPAARSSSKPVAAAKTTSPEPTMDNSRRGLPPPSAMTLPPESALPAVTAMGPLPPPPTQWHNAEDSMRQWLQTKAEEDRRRQEEERTRQESLRLEQRRIEQSMLRDAFHAGVPPHMVPLIFTGMAGGNAARSSLETNQQVDLSSPQSQPPQQHLRSLPPPPLSQHQQQQSHLAPPPAPVQPPTPSYTLSDEVRRDSRAIPPNPYGSQAGSALPAPPPSHAVPPSSTQPPAFGHVAGPALLHPPTDHRPPLPPPSSLSRLNTGDMQIHQPPANVGSQYQPSPASTQPPPTAPVKPESQAQQSPSIYFHHWVPPGPSQPNTPSGKSSETTPHSHLRSEYQTSPGRKRKAQGPHQPAPPPSSQPAQSSPALSHASPRHGTPRRGHGQGHLRHQSDISHESRYHEYQDQDPESGHRQSRPSGHESLMNPVHSDPENTSRRTSRGPGASADPQSARPERHEATASPSHYGEPQGPSQPSGYGAYHRPS